MGGKCKSLPTVLVDLAEFTFFPVTHFELSISLIGIVIVLAAGLKILLIYKEK